MIANSFVQFKKVLFDRFDLWYDHLFKKDPFFQIF